MFLTPRGALGARRRADLARFLTFVPVFYASSRTLTAVHDAILEDLVFPSEIVGKRIRVKLDGSRLIKVHLDKAQQNNVEHKVIGLFIMERSRTDKGRTQPNPSPCGTRTSLCELRAHFLLDYMSGFKLGFFFWLRWVCVAARGLSLVASGGYSLL